MLDLKTVQEIRRLLAEGQLSRRAIARRVHVSHATVAAISRNERQDTTTAMLDRLLPTPEGPLERCPHCGARVRMPCLACSLREAAKARRAKRPRPDDDGAAEGDP